MEPVVHPSQGARLRRGLQIALLAALFVSVSWDASGRDSADAKVRVGYVRIPTDTAELDLTDVQRIAEDLPLGPGSASWDLSEVPSGQYRLVITVEDGMHAPVETIADLVIDVDDRRAPDVPSGLAAEPLPGELLITWAPGAELDLAGYEIGFGVVQAGTPDDPANCIYSRDMGSKEVVLTATNVLDAKLWGLSDDEEVFVGIRAYDRSGNMSALSPLLRAKPWPLSAAAWTPVPCGKGQSEVMIAFETPLQATTLEEALVLRDASGVAVPGRLEQITSLDGDQVTGLRFVPARSLQSGASYAATLAGVLGGIQTASKQKERAMHRIIQLDRFAEIEAAFLARVQAVVWCSAATVDRHGRPRTRIVHPVWEGAVGWVTTRRRSPKVSQLAANPALSLAYIGEPFQPCYVECEATLIDDVAAKERIWALCNAYPEPFGFDPTRVWGAADDPANALLRLTPWRIELNKFSENPETVIWEQ